MKKVFISGSRNQYEIHLNIQESLELIKKQEMQVLIGDSEKGVDNEIIDYFRKPFYPYVSIFTINKIPRVSGEPGWSEKKIEVDDSLSSQAKQMEKDRAMAKEADFGLAIFKPIIKNKYGAIQVSSGTLRNVIQMLINKKPVKFFYIFEKKMLFKNLKQIDDLKNIIVSYKDEKLSADEIEYIYSSKGVNHEKNASIIKFEKIDKKFKDLYKKEDEINPLNTSQASLELELELELE